MIQFMRLFLSALVFASFAILYSCKSNTSKNHENIDLHLNFYAFYKDFSAIDTTNLQTGLVSLKEKYGHFLDVYLDDLTAVNLKGNYAENKVLHDFLTHKDFKELFIAVNKKFPNTQAEDKQITALLQNIYATDSSFIIPRKIYYYAAGLNYAAVILPDSSLGIGLDMYMGRDFEPYALAGFPSYLTIRNTVENMPIAVAKVIYEAKYPMLTDNKNLLEIMIEKGKEAYFVKQTYPDVKENLLFLFDEKQMKWCAENERLIYNYFIQGNLLYETNGQKIYRFINDAPTSNGMPPESPGNTGVYIGYKIIEAFANRSGKSLQEVLTEKDYKKILQESKYKP